MANRRNSRNSLALLFVCLISSFFGSVDLGGEWPKDRGRMVSKLKVKSSQAKSSQVKSNIHTLQKPKPNCTLYAQTTLQTSPLVCRTIRRCPKSTMPSHGTLGYHWHWRESPWLFRPSRCQSSRPSKSPLCRERTLTKALGHCQRRRGQRPRRWSSTGIAWGATWRLAVVWGRFRRLGL